MLSDLQLLRGTLTLVEQDIERLIEGKVPSSYGPYVALPDIRSALRKLEDIIAVEFELGHNSPPTSGREEGNA